MYFRINNKLLFHNCHTCATTNNRLTPCNHTDIERQITGTYSHIELTLSLEMGYTLLKVHEIWHYSEMCGEDSAVKQIFFDYMQKMFQTKELRY